MAEDGRFGGQRRERGNRGGSGGGISGSGESSSVVPHQSYHAQEHTVHFEAACVKIPVGDLGRLVSA